MTSTGKHHKHPPIIKPTLGEWGRNEVAILGAPCGVIRTLAEAIAKAMDGRFKVCFVDADHADADGHENHRLKFDALFTDKIQSRRIDLDHEPNTFERRSLLASCDIILVNGNHFSAREQIVLLHSKKRESLERKLDKLSNVIAILEMDIGLSDCPFLNPYLQPTTKIFQSRNESGLTQWVGAHITIPAVKGLVLAGGRSVRMGGKDKTRIEYHGTPQRDHVCQLLEQAGIPAYISCRPEQADDMRTTFPLVTDRFTGLGPFGAILSAMMTFPDNAWLIVATDLPLISTETFYLLLNNRDPSKNATAFHNPTTGFPEPLITLWEPKAYPLLLSFLAQGINCPRKALINSDVKVIEPDDANWLTNVNTPEEAEAVRRQLT